LVVDYLAKDWVVGASLILTTEDDS
jgi:hypothetical protein